MTTEFNTKSTCTTKVLEYLPAELESGEKLCSQELKFSIDFCWFSCWKVAVDVADGAVLVFQTNRVGFNSKRQEALYLILLLNELSLHRHDFHWAAVSINLLLVAKFIYLDDFRLHPRTTIFELLLLQLLLILRRHN